MTSVFNLYESFPAFICANNIKSLINNLFGVKIFNPPSSSAFCSSASSDGMSDKSTDLPLLDYSPLLENSSFSDHSTIYIPSNLLYNYKAV